jgi:signal transduction histidine kinase
MKKGNKAILSVKDEGVGISSEMKGEIFHLFANEGNKGTSGEESFGLGLSIARQIIEAHGGRIWFISEKGKGTTFYVELNLYYPGVTVANNK